MKTILTVFGLIISINGSFEEEFMKNVKPGTQRKYGIYNKINNILAGYSAFS